MFNLIIYYFKKLFGPKQKVDSNFQYRKYLFDELKEIVDFDYFRNKRILEIGPRDGEDSLRLVGFQPKDLVIIDLPNRTQENKKWLDELNVETTYIEGNLMYLSKQEIEKLGRFDLIWFTGVLYHNPEQLRMIKRLYNLLNTEGYLVLESSVTRKLLLKNKNTVEIHYPKPFRNTDTITHLPSKLAIKSWLGMSGFIDVVDSKCFEYENYNIKNHRYACIAVKNKNSKPMKYYSKFVDGSNYEIGDSL